METYTEYLDSKCRALEAEVKSLRRYLDGPSSGVIPPSSQPPDIFEAREIRLREAASVLCIPIYHGMDDRDKQVVAEIVGPEPEAFRFSYYLSDRHIPRSVADKKREVAHLHDMLLNRMYNLEEKQ